MAADEEVDVVDGDDRVIGRATRAEVRARNLRHRATYILVFNRRGQLFVHQRVATKDIYPSYIDVAVGGVVGAGESYDAAAERELAEELGIRGVPLRREAAFAHLSSTNQVNGVLYSCVSDGPVQLQAEEIADGEWLDLEEVERRMRTRPFCPDGIEALQLYMEKHPPRRGAETGA